MVPFAIIRAIVKVWFALRETTDDSSVSYRTHLDCSRPERRFPSSAVLRNVPCKSPSPTHFCPFPSGDLGAYELREPGRRLIPAWHRLFYRWYSRILHQLAYFSHLLGRVDNCNGALPPARSGAYVPFSILVEKNY